MKNDKKQIPLRISAELYAELERWAQDEFRSINGQIEYILTQSVCKRKGNKSGIYGGQLQKED
ncbi:MAG: Arc family DNA-binding protein [Clostridiales bacterium]|nr:Arc family DNA-binding protein [Clostridiales bacterium]